MVTSAAYPPQGSRDSGPDPPPPTRPVSPALGDGRSLREQSARCLVVLTLLASLGALRVARDIVMPLVIGLFASLILQPAVELLMRLRLPRGSPRRSSCRRESPRSASVPPRSRTMSRP